MTALLVSIAEFGVWWVVGLAVLSAAGAETAQLRMTLATPVVGSATTVLVLFTLSHFGIGMGAGATPAVACLLALSLATVVYRRPSLSRAVLPVLGLCLVDLVLIGRPTFTFGFSWIANANDDMANYVLSATDLIHHGLTGPINYAPLKQDRDYATLLRVLHNEGARPGSDITLAALSSVAHKAPYALFMPQILALNMCAVCGTGALAAQASRRWWTPTVAAALIIASPLAAFGVLQQLMPQIWGLALATTLFALLMRPELHTSPGARVRDLVPIAILATGFVLVYVELAASVAGAYVLYVAILVLQRRVNWRALARLWGAAVGFALIVLNAYLFRELRFVSYQAHGGVKVGGGASLFGFVLVPAELPAIVGLQTQDASAATRYLSTTILIAIVLLVTLTVAAVFSATQGVAAVCVLVTFVVLGLFLGIRSTDFGLYKLFMYAQPFVAAAVAVWLSRIRWRPVFVGGCALLVCVVAAQLRTEAVYVRRSRNPIDLTHASAASLLPTFRRWLAAAHEPVLPVTDNPVLAKLEVAGAGARPVYFLSKFFFSSFASPAQMGWTSATFLTGATNSQKRDPFLVNLSAEAVLAKGRCLLVLPTSGETVINRRWLSDTPADLVERQCGQAQNLLVYTSSSLGQAFYLPVDRSRVSYYQLEPDYFYPGHTFAAFGRYALFSVLNPSKTVRLEIWLTTTLFQNGANNIPPAKVDGATRASLPVIGRGSARLISPPLKPEMIDGQPYILLDMGMPGRLAVGSREGVQALYGQSIPLDPRYLTSYVRDVSLMTERQYRDLRSPLQVASFPEGLANPNLEYSGIYEDGWEAADSYLVLGGGRAARLAIRANVLPLAHQRLRVAVNGHAVVSERVGAGALRIDVPIRASPARRRVTIQWTEIKQLGPQDHREAAAQLEYVGIVQPPVYLSDVPKDLSNPGLDYAGFFSDGWAQKDAQVVLAQGPSTALVLHARVLARSAGESQHLRVIVNGRVVWSASVRPGALSVVVRISASGSPRRVDLEWAATSRIAADDPREAAALVEVLGLDSPGASR